jgi:hypothetical protein
MAFCMVRTVWIGGIVVVAHAVEQLIDADELVSPDSTDFSVSLTFPQGNTELEIRIITKASWTATSGIPFYVKLLTDIKDSNPSLPIYANDDVAVMKREIARNNDMTNLFGFWDSLLNRKISIRVRQCTKCSYLGWGTSAPPLAGAPTSGDVLESGKIGGSLVTEVIGSSVCQWSRAFAKPRTNPSSATNTIGIHAGMLEA